MVIDFEHITFPTYETASLRSRNITCPFDLDEKHLEASEIFNIYSTANIAPILSAAVNLLGILLSHYAIVPIGTYLLFSSWLFNGPLVGASSLILPTIALFCIIHITVNAFHRPLSHISGKVGSNSVGSTTASGLYHMRSGNVAEILKNCPILTASTTLSGCLPKLHSTPWIFSGDMRTILPFLAFKPKKIAYKRRWVRVPLTDGPLGDVNREDSAYCTTDEHSFEAVAVDCSYASDSDVTESSNDIQKDGLSFTPASGNPAGGPEVKEIASTVPKNASDVPKNVSDVPKSETRGVNGSSEKEDKFVLLILAGLTGGSGEGYVLDLVHSANIIGVDCYVMLGRGLGDTPNLSEAAFHGARTSDVRETAKVLRKSLSKGTRIFVVGISMGGIIVTNAVGRAELTGLVDGAVSVCGCFDTSKNMNFTHSRTYWQPLLNFGLKDAFVSPPGALQKMSRRMGPMARHIVESTKDIIGFDSCVVTALHRFRDVYHYYSDMSGCSEQRLLDLIAQQNLKHSTSPGKPDSDFKVVDVDIDLHRIHAGQPESTVTSSSSSTSTSTSSSTHVAESDTDWVEISTERRRKKTADVTADREIESGLAVPLLSIHAADDPIIHVDTLPCRTGIVEAVDNLVCLVTSVGGHVGWPVGWKPWINRWCFQNTLILEFCSAIAKNKRTSTISAD